jgi:hypothetical protein
MAHWAEIDEKNIVTRVLVCKNDEPNEGHDWLIDNLGGTWIKTSYNTLHNQHLLGGTPLRGNYAGMGYYYDEKKDVFIPPKPYPSWTLSDEIADWVPPVARPESGSWGWDEEALSWVEN